MSYRVRLAALVGSFTAISKSRCVRTATPVWLSPPAGNMLPHAALSPGHLHTNRLESLHPAPGVRTGRLGVLSCLFSSGLGGSFPLFEVRRVALDVLLLVVHLPVPQHVLYALLLICTSLCHRSFHSLTSVAWIFFRSALTRSVASHRFTLSVVSLLCSCGMV